MSPFRAAPPSVAAERGTAVLHDSDNSVRGSDRVVRLPKLTVDTMFPSDHKEASSARAGGQEPIGALIQAARKRRGLSQYALADKLAALSGNDSVTRHEVARWERAKRIPGPYWRTWISRALDLPLDQLRAAARSARSRRSRSSPQGSAIRVRP